jgi:hypothetical protein
MARDFLDGKRIQDHAQNIIYFTLLIFLDMYETHLKKFDILKNKCYDKTEGKLWKEQENLRKIFAE